MIKKTDERKIIYLYDKKLYTYNALSKLFLCSRWKIGEILKKYNITANNKRKFRNKDYTNKIIKLYNSGKTTTEISKLYNCSGDYIRKILKRNRIDTSTKVNININILKELLFDKNYSLGQLCDFFNCSSNTIERCFKKSNIDHMPYKYEIDLLNGIKICNCCKKERSIDWFSRKKLKFGNNTIIGDCKECISIKNKNARVAAKNKIKPATKKEKQCSRCKKIKNIEYFSKCSSNPDGFQYICKSCQKFAFRNYSINNPDKIFEIRNRRREREKMVKNNYSKINLKTTMSVFDNKCFNCGSGKNLSIDHHCPLSKGNPLKIDNAVLLCKSCNSSKRDTSPEVFYSKNKLKKLNKKLKRAKALSNNSQKKA